MTDEFDSIADDVVINVGGKITQEVDFTKEGHYIACGPEVMMRSAYELAKENKKTLDVSLEKRMGCGIGACFGCTIFTPKGNKKICKDGPVFPGEDVFENE